MFELFKDLWEYLVSGRKYWVAPILIALLLLGIFIAFTEQSVVGTFIYAIF